MFKFPTRSVIIAVITVFLGSTVAYSAINANSANDQTGQSALVVEPAKLPVTPEPQVAEVNTQSAISPIPAASNGTKAPAVKTTAKAVTVKPVTTKQTAKPAQSKPVIAKAKAPASRAVSTTPASASKGKGAQLMDWWAQGSKVFAIGTTATITDTRTGISFKVIRTGGGKHADVESLTSADLQAIKRIWGGFSWERRPVVVSFGNYRIAAGMTGFPEGFEKLTNNGVKGHFNIHFLNSTTSSGNWDAQYQAAAKAAVGY